MPPAELPPATVEAPTPFTPQALAQAYETACAALLAERCDDGFWVGELASSALATATAVSALALAEQSGSRQGEGERAGDPASQIANCEPEGSRSLRWLADHQNADGGWGDTTLSVSNISTTMLVRAAFEIAGAAGQFPALMERATAYIDRAGGVAALVARYGKDRTFAVPILANCALAGQADWSEVSPLPFELAALPHSFFRFLRLHVVSYALPALIAIGQLIHAKRPTHIGPVRWIRNWAIAPTLRKLASIQPSGGGFLEAVPLTSFVTMSLAALGQAEHPVTRKGVEFLRSCSRPDGSWPIDSNLSLWLTTLSINALAVGGTSLDGRTREWLIAQQQTHPHPYTNAAPGGWGWSHLPGSVPDADDTAGALLALANPGPGGVPHSPTPFEPGVSWLLGLQNRDGGWPTFCRGWGKLPFDRSGADLTAHALRALWAWRPFFTDFWEDAPFDRAIRRGIDYLRSCQRPDGSWVPLWFGNQHAPNEENPTYGTARVLAGYRDLDLLDSPEASRGIAWLGTAQNPDGGWGGAPGIPSSVEETALALDALATPDIVGERLEAVERGVAWLVDRVKSGEWKKPSPIGFYFAKLWYFEKLYPQIFTVAALGRARQVLAPQFSPASARAP